MFYTVIPYKDLSQLIHQVWHPKPDSFANVALGQGRTLHICSAVPVLGPSSKDMSGHQTGIAMLEGRAPLQPPATPRASVVQHGRIC